MSYRYNPGCPCCNTAIGCPCPYTTLSQWAVTLNIPAGTYTPQNPFHPLPPCDLIGTYILDFHIGSPYFSPAVPCGWILTPACTGPSFISALALWHIPGVTVYGTNAWVFALSTNDIGISEVPWALDNADWDCAGPNVLNIKNLSGPLSTYFPATVTMHLVTP